MMIIFIVIVLLQILSDLCSLLSSVHLLNSESWTMMTFMISDASPTSAHVAAVESHSLLWWVEEWMDALTD